MSTIFVFGSNRAGRHGKGAALYARQNHGAISGRGEGLQGQSYAIPTKDENLKPLPLAAIAQHVQTFLAFAEEHPELKFLVTAIGTGLAGYKPEDIAPMFAITTSNVWLPHEFEAVLVGPGGMSYQCPRCGKVSHNPHDLAHGYCGACHDWTGR